MKSILIPLLLILTLCSIISIHYISTLLISGHNDLSNDYSIQLRNHKLHIQDDYDNKASVDLETLFDYYVNEDHIIQENIAPAATNEVETGKDEISRHHDSTTTTNQISTTFLKNDIEQPKFIIIGVQKGGTSALDAYLSLHKQLQSSTRFEPHFFDLQFEKIISEHNIAVQRNITNGKLIISSEGKKLLLNKYWDYAFPSLNRKRKNGYGSKLFFEKTPAYILKPNVPHLMQALLPWVQMIIILRDPVERAISHYKMMFERYTRINAIKARKKEKLYDIPSFSDCIELEMKILVKTGVIPGQNITESRANYDAWINIMTSTDPPDQYKHSQSFPSTIPLGTLEQNWLNYYNRSRKQIICDSMVGRGLYIFQLRNWLLAFHDTETRFQDRFLILNNESILPSPDHIVDLTRVTDFLHVKEMVIKEAPIIHPTTDLLDEDTFNDEVKDKLRRIYEPFNRQLYKILGDEWKNAWV